MLLQVDGSKIACYSDILPNKKISVQIRFNVRHQYDHHNERSAIYWCVYIDFGTWGIFLKAKAYPIVIVFNAKTFRLYNMNILL